MTDDLIAGLADLFGQPVPVIKVLLKSEEGQQLLGISEQVPVEDQIRQMLAR